MEARVRCCVAVTFEPSIEVELNVVRRLLGSGSLGWIPPHITLLPPVDTTVAHAWEMVSKIATLCAQVEPIAMKLGQFGVFENRRVSGHLSVLAGHDELAGWRSAVGEVHGDRAFIPHVTVIEDLRPELAVTLADAFADYALTCHASEVTLLVADARGRRRGWRPFLRGIVGQGGLHRRSHLQARTVLSAASPAAVRARVGSVSVWLLDPTSGELIGWVDAFDGPSGWSIVGDVTILDPDAVGFGLEELLIEELVSYLRPMMLVAPEYVRSLDPFGPATLAPEVVRFVDLKAPWTDGVFGAPVTSPTFQTQGFARSDADQTGSVGQFMRWKFLNFSTR